MTALSPAQAAAQQDAQEQAAKAEAAAKRAEDAAAKAEEERKRIAQASVRAADRFELGQDPMDSLTGQGSILGAPEPTTAQETGPFGPILTQYRGDAQGPIKALTALKDGEAIAALNHPGIGDIDPVWGKEGTRESNGFGLSKLVKWHPEVLDDLQGVVSPLTVVERTENRIQLESEKHKAAVRLEWDKQAKNWLLTALRKRMPVATRGQTLPPMLLRVTQLAPARQQQCIPDRPHTATHSGRRPEDRGHPQGLLESARPEPGRP